jgi:hypothetical protein
MVNTGFITGAARRASLTASIDANAPYHEQSEKCPQSFPIAASVLDGHLPPLVRCAPAGSKR